MKIKNVRINKRMKCIEIDTPKGVFTLPFLKLRLIPTNNNRIKEAYVDKELGNEAVTYILESGDEDSIHVDAFLDYNKDPEYMKEISLYKLTLKAIELIKESTLPKREVARKLKTSPAQLYRLLDTKNYSKTIDQMVKLLASLGHKIDFMVEKDCPPTSSFGETQSVPGSASVHKAIEHSSNPVARQGEPIRSSLIDKGEQFSDFPVIVEKYGTDQLRKYIKDFSERQPLMAA